MLANNPELLAQQLGWQEAIPLAGDASLRSYYRFQGKRSDDAVLMKLPQADAQTLKAGTYTWPQVRDYLASHAIPVPKILASFTDSILIEDLGNTPLQKADRKYYAQALELNQKFSQLPRPNLPWAQRSFNTELFIKELQFFRQHYLENHLQIQLSPQEDRAFVNESRDLADYLISLPQCFCHRDFHSQNLMIHQGQVVLIDFQDARWGPHNYDLVSLCFDAYVDLSIEQRQTLLQTPDDDWQAVLLQRQLKALGSFAFNTKNRPLNYLQYAPMACNSLKLCQDSRWPFLSQDLISRIQDA